jgi:hypothetical protein
MSIEKSLERIAAALEAVVELQVRGGVRMTAIEEPAPAPQPVPMNPNPYVPPEQQFPAAEPLKAAPAVTPEPAAPAPTAPALPPAPFTDHKTLSVYVMGKYRSLGPVKGALIQNVLSELGYKNINEVKPEHYASFYAKVEAL